MNIMIRVRHMEVKFILLNPNSGRGRYLNKVTLVQRIMEFDEMSPFLKSLHGHKTNVKKNI